MKKYIIRIYYMGEKHLEEQFVLNRGTPLSYDAAITVCTSLNMSNAYIAARLVAKMREVA